MPRKTRYIIPHIPHHVLQRGNNHQKIFFGKTDTDNFLFNLKKYAKENKVKIGAYCLMTNHFHLLLYPEAKASLIRFMKFISQLHSQFINRRYRRSGKLWENRYKLHMADPEYEWVIARYIERNPLRAKVVKKAEDYKYCSARAHLVGGKDEILTKDIVGQRQEDYRRFFNEKEANNSKYLKELRAIIQQEKILGNSKFIKAMEQKFKIFFRLRPRGRPRKEEN